MGCGVWYSALMASLVEIMFAKALIVGAWAHFAEKRRKRFYREKNARSEWEWKLRTFKSEWDRRTAKQPRLLTHRPAELAESSGAGIQSPD